ncbi:hypothetical protein Misp02_09910 [Microtetraspora sp. NBRC 16547]|nr:hypothetical protein Misp02_09910 [Microtetraspora sp. NBRC 16547]
MAFDEIENRAVRNVAVITLARRGPYRTGAPASRGELILVFDLVNAHRACPDQAPYRSGQVGLRPERVGVPSRPVHPLELP